jgi:putative spermidine/putrescine transport system ATP-binding protein
MSARNAVSVIDVTKVYDGPEVVRNVTFDLHQGELLTLLGPSGSGKSTTLAMVAGFEDPTTGDIQVDGRSVVGVPAERRSFGIVFQSYALFPHMSVLDNVGFALRMRKVPRGDRDGKAREMLHKVGLEGFEQRLPRQLSGGQQQRVALARALVFEPDALLLDEPLGSLDKALREALQIEIKEIQQRLGVSILFVTHDQDEAMMMSDRIAVMRDGRFEQIGAPADVYRHPANAFVATFLGETNLIPCELGSVNGKYAAVTIGGGLRSRARRPVGGAAQGPDGRCLSVRPERITVLQEGDAREVEIDGELVSRTFLGSQERLIAAALGQRFVIRRSEAEALPDLGSRVRFGWDPDDAQVVAK